MEQTRLSDKALFAIDSAADNDDITAAAHGSLLLFGDAKITDDILTCDSERTGSWREVVSPRFIALERYATSVAREQAPEVQRSLFSLGAMSTHAHTTWLCQYFAETLHQDVTRGGAMTDWLEVSRHNALGQAYRRTFGSLMSPKRIKRHVLGERETMPHQKSLLQCLRTLEWPKTLAEGLFLRDRLDEQREAIAARVKAQYEIADEKLSRDLEAIFDEDRVVKCRRQQRAERRCLVRALRLAENVVGGEQLRRFARGEPISIKGEHFVWCMLRGRDIHASGHGSMAVALEDHEGHLICGLCIFFDDTPLFDQLAAFALHIQCGNELELLEGGNIYSLSREGMRHPVIVNRQRQQPDMVRIRTGDHNMVVDLISLRKSADKLYWKKSESRYRDVIEHNIWGTDVFKMRRLHKTLEEAA